MTRIRVTRGQPTCPPDDQVSKLLAENEQLLARVKELEGALGYISRLSSDNPHPLVGTLGEIARTALQEEEG